MKRRARSAKPPAASEAFVPPSAECLLKPEAVCKALGVGRRKLYEMIAAGEYPKPVKIGTLSLWPVADHNKALQALIRSQAHARGVQEGQ